MKEVKILHLFPKLLSLYGEYGNIAVLKAALGNCTVTECEDGNADFENYDFIYIGSGTEDNLMVALERLLPHAERIAASVRKSIWLATGNALALFGKTLAGKPALGIFGYETLIDDKRYLGDVLTEGSPETLGFINTSCRYQGIENSLLQLVLNKNLGNDKQSSAEGIREGNFFGTQLIFNGFFYLIEAGLNLIGYSAISSMEAATAGSTTLSMFLYAGIIGPIVEELVFRGFILRALDRHGKPMAIVVSSVLFGIMHANIPQAVFAFFVGLVLGYVAERYSIWWSIILHILNNLVLGDLFSRAISGLGEEAQSIISFCVMGTFALVGVTLLILKRRDIIDYVKQHKGEKHRARWIATCSGVMIYFIINLALGIFMLEKI